MIGKRRGLMADWVAKTFNRSENGQANMSPSEQISFFSTHHTEGYPDGLFRCTAESELKYDLWYSVPDDFHAHNDSVATALSALCNRKYKIINYNFPISIQCKEAIEKRNSCAVNTPGVVEPRIPGRRCGLGFSGGYDSLAAWLLAQDFYVRVGVDWLGNFKRESDWFLTLAPDMIIRTNVRELGFNRIDNRFMGSGIALYADYLDLGEIAFGTITEAGPRQLRVTTPQSRPAEWLGAALTDATPTRGLNQICTGLMITRFAPELFEGSLASLASPGSEKYLRKQLIRDCALSKNNGFEFDFNSYVIPRNKIIFGESYAFDYITLYFLKKFGSEFVSRWADGLDKIEPQKLASVDEEFFYKNNPLFEPQISDAIRPAAISRMREAGIGAFTERDWRTLDVVRDILSPYHPVK
jgi:cyanophycin synthetase